MASLFTHIKSKRTYNAWLKATKSEHTKDYDKYIAFLTELRESGLQITWQPGRKTLAEVSRGPA